MELFFLSIFRSVTCSQSSFFRSFVCAVARVAFFLFVCVPPPPPRRRQSERISHNDVDCSRQLTIEVSARD